MSQSKVKKIVKRYAEVLKENFIPYREIYLYGSQVSGRVNYESDIDVAVVFPKVSEGLGYYDQKMQLRKYAVRVDTRLDPILLEKADFRKDSISQMAHEVKKYGQRIV